MHLATRDGGHAVELSGTILAMAARLPRPVADGLNLTTPIPCPYFVTRIEMLVIKF